MTFRIAFFEPNKDVAETFMCGKNLDEILARFKLQRPNAEIVDIEAL